VLTLPSVKFPNTGAWKNPCYVFNILMRRHLLSILESVSESDIIAKELHSWADCQRSVKRDRVAEKASNHNFSLFLGLIRKVCVSHLS
jgi:hypothetical protein